MFKTINQFLKAEYQARCDNAIVAKAYAADGGFKKFKQNYITCYGFSEYLLTIRGVNLSPIQTYHLAKMFYVYGKRSPSTLPSVLAGCARQYDLEFPTIYGILTKEYWQERFDDSILHT
jgi:hypothetical protein